MGNLWQECQMSDPSVEVRFQINTEATDTILLHNHPFYEILFCKSGNIQYLLGDKRFRLFSGDILLIPPGINHQPLFLEALTEPYERYVLWISKEFWNRKIQEYPDLDFAFLQCIKRGSYLLRSSRPTWSGLFSVIQNILKEQEERKLGWEFAVRYTTLMLMLHICRTYYYQDIIIPDAEKETLMDDIFTYIDVNLAEKISLNKIAEHFLVSKSTISHMFEKHFHISFYQCVIHRRLIKAKNDLLTGIPLKDIWENCGFSDYSTFYRAFKREYSMSPREFKKNYQKHIDSL